MTIKVVVEFQAKPGERSRLASVLRDLSRTHVPIVPAFLGSTVYETIDSPDGLIEIAEWESAEAQASAVEQARAAGVYAPVFELLAAPLTATRIREAPSPGL